MFGTLGGPEVILILVVALIVFGPRRLPEIGKSMGKMLAEFRKASNDFKRTIDDELEAEKVREAQAQIPAAPSYPAPPVESAPVESPPVEGTPAERAVIESTPVVVSAPEPWRPAYEPPPWSGDTPKPAPPAGEPAAGAPPAPEPEPRVEAPAEA